MADDFDRLFAALQEFKRDVHREAALGVIGVAGSVQNLAKATPLFNDDTGATRGSIVAYVVAPMGGIDQGGLADSAFSYAENRNPGHATDDYIDDEDEGVLCVLTVFTDYAPDLEARGAGVDGFIGPTMDEFAPILHDAAMRGIAKLL